jgi:hypothetical protein
LHYPLSAFRMIQNVAGVAVQGEQKEFFGGIPALWVVGWEKRSVPTILSKAVRDGGHGAGAPLPALRDRPSHRRRLGLLGMRVVQHQRKLMQRGVAKAFGLDRSHG